MSDSLEHRCALQSPRGTNSDYMSNQEKIYIDINDLCSLYWRRQTEEEKSFGQDRGCFVQCGVGTERSLKVHVEVGQSGEGGGRTVESEQFTTRSKCFWGFLSLSLRSLKK